MSSLIMVSPQKTGLKETGQLDVTKFVATVVPARLFGQTPVTCYPMYMKWVGDKFVVLARLDSTSSSFKRLWYVEDAANGMDGNGTGQTGQTLSVNTIGIEHGDGSNTIMGAFTSGSTTTNSTNVSVSYDLGLTWVLKSVTVSALWRHPVLGKLADGITPAWIIHNIGNTTLRRSSDDGQTWVSKAGKTLGNLAYSPTLNRWVQMSQANAAPWYSDDAGDTWVGAASYSASAAVPVTSPGGTPQMNYNSVRWIHDRFIALETAVPAFMYSFDGINWTEASFPALDVASASRMIYAGGLWLLCAEGSNTYAYSIDGINWSRTAFPAGFLFSHGDYGGGKFLFINNNSTKIYAYEFG